MGQGHFEVKLRTALSLEIASIERSISAFIDVNASVITITTKTIEAFTDKCTTSVDALRSLCITCVLILGFKNSSLSHFKVESSKTPVIKTDPKKSNF